MTDGGQTVLDQQSLERLAVGLRHLQDRAQLLVEQAAQGRLGPAVHMDFQTAVAGKRHFQQGHDGAAVRAIVVSQQQAASVRFLHQIEQRLQPLRIVQIGRHAAAAVEYLGQRRSAEAVAPCAQVDQPKIGVTMIQPQLRRQRAARVADAGEAGNHQRYRRHRALRLALMLPLRLHGQRVLADRDGNVQRGAQLHTDRFHRVEQRRVFTRMVDRRHPVGRQPNFAQTSNRRSGHIGDRLAHGETRGLCAIEHGDRRALGHRHRFADVTIKIRQRHRAIGNRNLPRADHRVAMIEATHRAVADGDQKTLAAHHRQPQHAQQRLVHADAGEVGQHVDARLDVLGVAMHARRLAE